MKLITLCHKYDKTFGQLYDDAEHLSPFATKFRYPTEFDIPDHKDTKSAIEQAERIVNFVLNKIANPYS